MQKMRKTYLLADSLDQFDLEGYKGGISELKGRKALASKQRNTAIFLSDTVFKPPYRVHAELAVAESDARVGIAFGALDDLNFELVYFEANMIRYDPIMNGSMTWQVYASPDHRHRCKTPVGRWQQLTIDVYEHGIIVYLGEDPEPRFACSSPIHGGKPGKVGIWSHLSAFIRKISIEQIPELYFLETVDPMKEAESGLVTEWLISQPFNGLSLPMTGRNWIKGHSENNGTLNIHRYYCNREGNSVEVRAVVFIPHAETSEMSVGFSDQATVWVNEFKVIEAEHIWQNSDADGSISHNTFKTLVNWQAGVNIIRAVLRQNEGFGWGISVNPNLAGMSLLTSAGLYMI